MNDQSTEIKLVLKAIGLVMKDVGYVAKSRSAGLPYSFASESDLIHAIRPSMIKHGLVMWVAGVTTEADERFESKNKSILSRSKIGARIRFAHITSGQWIEVAVQGEGIDTGDKGTAKALTGAFKYALRQTFIIETGDDPDLTNSTEQERSNTRSTATAAKPEMAGTDAKTQYMALVKEAKDEGIEIGDEWTINMSKEITVDRLRNGYRAVSKMLEEGRAEKPEEELTPQQKSARTRAANKAKKDKTK